MRKDLTELVFILDRSGSMSGLESDTIGGFNSMLKRQKEAPGRANVTTVLFDDRYEVLHDRIPIGGVVPMTGKQYYVRGCTALLDAVGKAISKTENVLKNTAGPERPGKVIVVITTDGLENASREYSRSKISRMITCCRKAGWEFLFLGANMDAVSEAGSLGISPERAVKFRNDSRGVKLNYKVVAETLCSMRASEEPISGDWMRPIEEEERRKQENGGRRQQRRKHDTQCQQKNGYT